MSCSPTPRAPSSSISSSRMSLRGLALASAVMAVASACVIEVAPPAPKKAYGAWSAPVLQNVDPSLPGNDEVPSGLQLSISPPDESPVLDPDEPEDSGVYIHEGSASLSMALFHRVEKFDEDGDQLVEHLADAQYSGRWTWRSSEDASVSLWDTGHLMLRMICDRVDKIDPEGPGGVCGQDGIPSELDVDCDVETGSAALPCRLMHQPVSFQRMQ